MWYKSSIKLEWFVFYTSPRAEKVVNKELVNKGYESFLPLQRKLRIWKNRQQKFIDEPLFPSYIFVKIHSSDIYKILKTHGIYMCIMFEGRPCTVPDKDIEAIRIMIRSEQSISSGNDFKEGEKVCIVRGPLIGYEGVLFKQKDDNKFGIQIHGVGLIAVIDIFIEDIQKIEE